MDFLKKSWFLVVLIAVASAAFYWFEWRPSEIRKVCYRDTKESYNSSLDSNKPSVGSLNSTYRLCLVRNGMKAEDMFK